MARLARVVVPGVAHHITQRGNHRQNVYFDDEDRRVYLNALGDNAARYGVRLLGYCLMSNHVHILAVPQREDALAKTFGRIHAEYARWQHIRQRQAGHLWQNRFFSCPLDSGHCWAALQYIERNPVRARIVGEPWDWEWSSARAHITGINASGLLDLAAWQVCWTAEAWKVALEKGVPDTLLEQRIREATMSGRPLGGDGFGPGLEQELSRPLMPQKRGRKASARSAWTAA